MPKKEIIYLHDLSSLDINGTKYEANGVIRSIVTDRYVFKDLSGFAQNEQLAYDCLEVWRDLGYSGAPSSPASFFRKGFHKRAAIKATTNNLFRPYFHGGWQEAFLKGSVLDTVYLYDIVKAYLWAGSLGLPSRIRPYHEGDHNFLGIVKMHKIRPDVPVYFRHDYTIATYKDIMEYDLSCEVIHGVSWDDLSIRPAEWIMKMKDYLPRQAWKLLTQGYWGVWGQTTPLIIHKKGGGKTELNNWSQNLVFATLIVHRVMMRLWEKAKANGISVYVDSVLTTDRIPEGDSIGDFKLKKTFPEGIFIKAPGVYTGINEHGTNLRNWFRHSGYK